MSLLDNVLQKLGFISKPEPVPQSENIIQKNEPPAANAEEEEQRTHKDLIKQYADAINFIGTDDEIIEKIQLSIFHNQSYYYGLGTHHGTKGARDFEIEKDTQTFATLVTDRINSVLKGRIDALDYQIKAEETKKEMLNKASAEYQKHYDDIIFTRNNDYKQFSKWLSICYIAFSFAMVLSDIAISVNLMGFFGIGGDHTKDASSWLKYIDFDLLMFALGIAFCTVFVKILYDEYIDDKAGYHEMLLMRLEKDNVPLSGIKRAYYIKLGVKLIIFAGLLGLLYYLAKYRADITRYQPDLSVYYDSLKKNEIDIYPVLLKCYIGISIMIPVISGICLSLGLKIWGNRKLMAEAESNKNKAAEELRMHLEGASKNLDRHMKLRRYQEEWERSAIKVKLLSEAFANKYDQGFRIAYRQEHSNDIFVIVEEYRNELMNKIFTKSITGKTFEAHEN